MEIGRKLRVVVVDDSIFIRKALKDMIESDGTITVVAEAVNGSDGVDKVKQLKPDVVTMDIEMPVMTGLQALKKLMQEHPLPVIMVSSLTIEGAKETMEALESGAVDFIPKNLEGKTLNILRLKQDLVEKIKRVAGSKILGARKKTDLPGMVVLPSKAGHRFRIITIGASTGGPRAVQEIIPRLPKDFPVPILIVQHMPSPFTQMFAERLAQMSQIQILEARAGEKLMEGHAYVVPGDYHLSIKKRGPDGLIQLSKEPADAQYKPSINTAMISMADAFPSACMGVLLTGMGSDGVEGLRAIRGARGYTIAQDESSCVVYGMPRAAVEAGVVDKVLRLDQIAPEIAQNA